MRRASSGEDSACEKTSATKSMRFSTLMVTMDQGLAGSGSDFGMTAEIGGTDGFVAPQFVGLAAEHDTAGFQYIAIIGNRQSHARILLDEQDRGGAADLGNDTEHRL